MRFSIFIVSCSRDDKVCDLSHLFQSFLTGSVLVRSMDLLTLWFIQWRSPLCPKLFRWAVIFLCVWLGGMRRPTEAFIALICYQILLLPYPPLNQVMHPFGCSTRAEAKFVSCQNFI